MRITRWAGTGLLVLGLGPLALASSDSVTITNRAPRSTWKVVAVPLEAKEAKDEVQESKVSQAQSSILGPGQSRVITLPGAAQVLYRLVDGQDKVRGSLVVHRAPASGGQAGRARIHFELRREVSGPGEMRLSEDRATLTIVEPDEPDEEQLALTQPLPEDQP